MKQLNLTKWCWALMLAIALLSGALLLACSSGDDDDNDTDDDAVDDDATDDDAADDDAADDDATDDDDDNDDDNDDDDNTPADCPPITQEQATRFYWPDQPPFMAGQVFVLGVTQSGHNILAPAGIIAMHGLKVDQLQWTLVDGDTMAPDNYDLTVPDGGTILDGNPNMYVSMIFNATMSGTYDEWWISVSGCAQIVQTGWIGDTFEGHLQNVVFRQMLDPNTGEIDWDSDAMGFNGAWDITKTIQGQ